MIDTLADLVPLYGIILIIGVWCFGSYLVSKKYSKDLDIIESHDKIKEELAKSLGVDKKDVIEIWFDKTLRDAKGIYLIDSNTFKNYIFKVSYTNSTDKFETEIFTKTPDVVSDF